MAMNFLTIVRLRLAKFICTMPIIFFTSSIFAAPTADLAVTVTGPANPMVYSVNSYSVEVNNIGNRDASNVVLSVEFPQTATSPQVFILGDLSNMTSNCQLVNRILQCNLGQIRKSKSASRSFDFKFPQAAKTLAIKASVTTSSAEVTTNNNAFILSPNLAHPSISITSSKNVTNSHCTGSPTLSSYFECLKFPSSISSHGSFFDINGTISFPNQPEADGYTGDWQISNSQVLNFKYFFNGEKQIEFSGMAVDNSCFEGVTNFFSGGVMNLAYVGIYRVCLQP